ncbi:MAG TPA: DNA ligase D [Pusillimonas sp.]|uniref:DNA ligase D n=1 Tax=unclassified Pusillimonas TaxID=2640016 RepID=UPI00261A757B|nr:MULTISPECIES: DNA ligase D [unclassified Pusillimonas]HLU19734.1 DNA ligase D [Pusillimonas sp.]
MKQALQTYREKRDFDVTAEPKGAARKQKGSSRPSYVIQRHQARRLHYDFRLEINGVLVSWAVPKGPSLDTSVKRLAVHVEDHPLEYAKFEGEIPRGQYGAGRVEIWDKGRWTPESDPVEALAKGRLKFQLDGGLQGRWLLVRTGKQSEQWLLRKLEDEHAVPGHDAERDGDPVSMAATSSATKATARTSRKSARKSAAGRTPKPKAEAESRTSKASLPTTLEPQLATLVDRPPAGKGWSYEVKYDGYRIVCRFERGKVSLLSRNGKSWNARMKNLVKDLADLDLGEGWIDGEVVCFDDRGISNFQALQQALDGNAKDLVFVAFDLPFWNGIDLRQFPLSERQQRLADLLEPVPANAPIMLTQMLDVASDTEGESAWTEACRLSLEGLICKKSDSPYVSGRSKTWLKLKCRPHQEFVVGGYSAPSGSRSHFGSLLVGLRDGKRLSYAGRVGTGFNQQALEQMHDKLKPLHRKTSPFTGPVESNGRYGRGNNDIQWVTPKLIVEVDYADRTDDGLLRQASFRGLREDKPASAVTGEEMASIETVEADANADKRVDGKNSRGKSKASRSAMGGPVSVEDVKVTHPDRIIYTKPDRSKLDLVTYYAEACEWILPHLKSRRIALLRCPQGTNQTCFFQKHLRGKLPPGVALDDEQIVVENERGLLELVQYGVIEFHTWGSSLPKPENPDRITLDLDPDPDIPWADVVVAARLVQRLMEDAGLTPFLKTTGGKGLHLVAPIKPSHPWDTVKEFSRALAAYLAREAPNQFTASVSKARRKGVVFVDYLRNGRGATAIAAFSARARQGAPVSMPVAWEELDPKKDMRASYFNIQNALKHRRMQGLDPWQAYASSQKTLRLAFRKELKG